MAHRVNTNSTLCDANSISHNHDYRDWLFPNTETGIAKSRRVYEEIVMPRRPVPSAAGLGLLFPLLLVIIALSAIFVPLFPSITGTFSTQTVAGSPTSVQVKLLTASYSRQAIISSIGSSFNSITIPVQQVQTGNYILSIGISYSNIILANTTLPNAGDGVYVFKVIFNWRVETSGVPYIVIISVSMNGQFMGSISFVILPS